MQIYNIIIMVNDFKAHRAHRAACTNTLSNMDKQIWTLKVLILTEPSLILPVIVELRIPLDSQGTWRAPDCKGLFGVQKLTEPALFPALTRHPCRVVGMRNCGKICLSFS